jgi:hypothetical protein
MEENVMNNEIKELLDKINEDEQKYGGNIYTQTAKTNDNEVDYFKKWIRKYYKKGFSEYIDFIKIINGLNNNGLFLYSLNPESEFNIYKNNETWWDEDDELKKYIFFGDDDISWYCLSRKDGKYYILDKPGGDVMDKYKTFDKIIIKSLKIVLGIDEE